MLTSSTDSDPSRPPLDPVARVRIEDATKLVADDLLAAEDLLASLLASDLPSVHAIAGTLALSGGKRLRPLLVLLGAKAAGFRDTSRLTVAAVGELMHTATLLHDDVVDGGEYRRGRPCARSTHGNGAAVLTGDYCYARAMQAMARLDDLRAMQTMSDAVTFMAEGEVAQLEIAGSWEVTRQDYDMVVERKTAALIAWCSSVAGLPEPDLAQALARYGRRVGHAFQIADDVLDYAAGVETSGKARGQDLREGKVTLPLLLAFESCAGLRGRVRAMFEAGPHGDDARRQGIITEVTDCGALERATRVAEAHGRAAIGELAALPASAARDALAGVALQITRRTR